MAKFEEKPSVLSPSLTGVYIPVVMLVVGTAIVKIEYIWYSIGLAVVLAGFKMFRGQPRKILKPEIYQSFDLKEKNVLSHNTAIYRFALPRANDVLGLPIGQHVSIAANIDGKEIVRSYTPVSSDLNTGFFDLLIKSYPTGNISRHIAELKIGQSIRAKGPKGQMTYTPNMVQKLGMIAGGTGITPMLQITKAIMRNPDDKTTVDLIFANVTAEDILLKEDLDELATQYPEKFKVHYVLNTPPEGWKGGAGFVTPEMIKDWLPAPSKDVKILICGPPPMVSAMKKATASLGYDPAKPVSKLDHQVFCF